LRPWLEAEREQDDQQLGPYLREFRDFADWAEHYDLDICAGGSVVAAYLIEMTEAGASLPHLMRVASALDFFFRRSRRFLDVVPIDAALAYAAAQTAPDRVLN
jgi:hypothetical protein